MATKTIRLALVFLLLFVSGIGAQTPHVVDVNKLTNELQRESPNPDELTMVWWIPADYWRFALAGEKLPSAQIEEFVKILKPYTIIAVFDGKIGANGATTFRNESDVRKSIRFIDAAGTEHAPMSADKIGPTPTQMLTMIRPIVANALGKVGANFHFIVFPGIDAQGGPVADLTKSGSVRVRLAPGREYAWKLPLTSLLPPKKCPIDGEKMSGDWRYCPWHGAELKNQE